MRGVTDKIFDCKFTQNQSQCNRLCPFFLLHEHFSRMMPQYTIEGRASKWSPLNSVSQKKYRRKVSTQVLILFLLDGSRSGSGPGSGDAVLLGLVLAGGLAARLSMPPRSRACPHACCSSPTRTTGSSSRRTASCGSVNSSAGSTRGSSLAARPPASTRPSRTASPLPGLLLLLPSRRKRIKT